MLWDAAAALKSFVAGSLSITSKSPFDRIIVHLLGCAATDYFAPFSHTTASADPSGLVSKVVAPRTVWNQMLCNPKGRRKSLWTDDYTAISSAALYARFREGARGWMHWIAAIGNYWNLSISYMKKSFLVHYIADSVNFFCVVYVNNGFISHICRWILFKNSIDVLK